MTKNDRLRVISNCFAARVVAAQSRFNVADDNLSRAASAMRRISDSYAEAYDRDGAFDGGEFSGPALAASEENAVRDALGSLGFDVESYNKAVEFRTSGRYAYVHGLLA